MIVLNSAGYGVVTISQSVSIVAPPGVYAGISALSGQTGVTINAPGATVVLRGLSINGLSGSLNGIQLVQAARVRVEGCTISNLGSVGIVHGAAGSELVVLDSIIRDNGGRGVSMTVDASAVFDNVRVEHNGGDGVYIVASSTGTIATIRRSVLSHNAAAGVAAIMPTSPAVTRMVIEDSTLANNGGDGVFAGGNLDGKVYAIVRRNSIAGNAFSGISAFNATPGPAAVEVDAVENSFAGHATSAVKTDGNLVDIEVSRNEFNGGIGPSFYSANGGAILTYGDNTGDSSSFGLLPIKVPAL